MTIIKNNGDGDFVEENIRASHDFTILGTIFVQLFDRKFMQLFMQQCLPDS